jgi:hypothetical protein
MDIRNSILAESTEDYIGLWAILWNFRQYSGETNHFKLRCKTLELIKELLDGELIQAGTFVDGEFELWQLSVEDVIDRITSEWDALGRDPDIGEIAWFVATEKGEHEVQAKRDRPSP